MSEDHQNPPLNYVRNEDLFVITYIYVVFGAITLFLNIPLAIYLLKTTSKNQKELIVIIALSLSDTVCAGQFLAMGIYRFVVWFSDVLFISQAACNRNIIVASYQICIQMDNLFGLTIALDRLFAVLLPVRYNKCGPGYTFFIVTSPVAVSLLGYCIHLLAISLLPPKFVDNICFNFSSVLPWFRNYLAYQRMLCVFIPIIIYFFIYIRMKLRFQRYGNSNSVLNKGMRHLTKTVSFITLASVFLVLIPEVWWYFTLFGGMDASIYFMFILLKKIVTFFIHTIRHRELMKHVHKVLPRKLTKLINFDAQSHSAVSKVKVIRESSHPVTTSMR
ncbi:G-protein coupled receptors family 1 profile domain-containing protein [Caenorhabditis elegans]|uniref:G-protein coupled receptors family 1 profile domain-containing protein n=1 Tax=Caenorhabditis elegans TaxID=6239 RepID=Q9XWS9_CAEEL|nr:G-protein coupled receptors family 1 profile domain-containing protein [Caenorhabditis elegans]CAA21566.2 G-protein coupled receptors family 1 profile domain-containing protein [Caenorhabditis elegans]|eukprot:NP_509991.2 Uncharacterized protein CELE_Y62H9A.10 [Caenorhabditis elegans]